MSRLPLFIVSLLIFCTFIATPVYAVQSATSSGQVLGFSDFLSKIFSIFSQTNAPAESEKIVFGRLPQNAVETLSSGRPQKVIAHAQSTHSGVLAAEADNEASLKQTAQNAGYLSSFSNPGEPKPVDTEESFFNVMQWLGLEQIGEKGTEEMNTSLQARVPYGAVDQYTEKATTLATGIQTHQCMTLPHGATEHCYDGALVGIEDEIDATSSADVTPPAPGCCAAGTGACAPDSLRAVFQGNAERASQICQVESGGNADKIVQQCSGSGPYFFKVGLFQLDMLSLCPNAFAKDENNKIKQPCILVDNAALVTCLQKYTQPSENIQAAYAQSKQGGDFTSWPSAYQCGLGGSAPPTGNFPPPGEAGRVYYAQTDSRWANIPYEKGICEKDDGRTYRPTLMSFGCGPTTVAMILSSFGDRNGVKTGYTPPEVLKKLYPEELKTCLGTVFDDHRKKLEQEGFETANIFDIRPDTMPIPVAAKEFRNFIKSGWQIMAVANYELGGSWIGHFFWVVDVDDAGNVWIMDPWKGASAQKPINQNLINPQPKYKAAFAFKKK